MNFLSTIDHSCIDSFGPHFGSASKIISFGRFGNSAILFGRQGSTTDERSLIAKEKRQSQLKRYGVLKRQEPQSSSCIRKPGPKYVGASFVVVIPHWDQHMVRVVDYKVLQPLMETRHDDIRVNTEGER